MRGCLARGLASVLAVVSLGAAQAPNGSGSKVDSHASKLRQGVAAVQTGPRAKPNEHAPYQVGVASWYGSDFEGKETASGEPYHMFDLTAAHPTLPLGSWVRVTNLHNGRSVQVRINDRGPIIPGRIIDLSYGAASVLHFKDRGLQRVRLDVVPAPHESQPREVAMLELLAN